ncbi:hypothetical protein [Streptomyces sp. NPDC001594]|uniref:hypothetical protein n=1 Tax=Streptomyces sp. NPDC001594 TaxID=3364590 RepID=UPI0036B13CB9
MPYSTHRHGGSDSGRRRAFSSSAARTVSLLPLTRAWNQLQPAAYEQELTDSRRSLRKARAAAAEQIGDPLGGRHHCRLAPPDFGPDHVLVVHVREKLDHPASVFPSGGDHPIKRCSPAWRIRRGMELANAASICGGLSFRKCRAAA